MAQSVTFDDVWRMIQESNRNFHEMVQEDRERRAETDRKFQEMVQEDRERRAETDRKFQETDRVVEKMARKVDAVSTQVGQLGGRWGEFVEGLIAPACIAMFAERGIQVDEVYSRVKKTIAGKQMEIDLLVVNTVDAVLVEVKSQLQVEDVRHHLERLADFKSFFPRYANCQVYGAIAGIVVESEADQFAMRHGLFVITQSGDTVKLANSPDFKPKVW